MDCQDYECKCPKFQEDEPTPFTAPGYCVCGCHGEDHGKGFDAVGQAEADEGRAVIEAMFSGSLGLN